MVEQINSLGSSPTIKPVNLTDRVSEAQKTLEAQDFKDLLTESINEVNRLQAKSSQGQIDLVTGKTDNVAEVFTAMQKSGLAYQALLQIRNKLLEAYDEIKRMNV